MKKIFLYLCIIIFSVEQPFAGFYSYGIIPANPTENDTVKCVFHTMSNGIPSNFYSNGLIMQNDSIYVKSCWVAGQLTSGIDVYDTILIGKLTAGTYTLGLAFYETQSPNDSSCSTTTTRDSATIVFSVTGSLGIHMKTTSFTLTPNPATNQLTISTEPSSNTTLQILSIEGKQIITIPLTQSTQSIDISTLPPGLYFAVLQNEQGRVVRKFVKAAP